MFDVVFSNTRAFFFLFDYLVFCMFILSASVCVHGCELKVYVWFLRRAVHGAYVRRFVWASLIGERTYGGLFGVVDWRM